MEDGKNYISDIPKQWQGAGKVLRRDRDLQMVMVALSELDPSSAPGPEGFSGGAFKTQLAPVMLQLIRTAAADSTLPIEWIREMTRCIPKEARIPASDSLRPITLLNCKMKWLTRVLELCLEDLVQFIFPREQKGFMKRQCMDDHLRHGAVQRAAGQAAGQDTKSGHSTSDRE